MKESPMKSLSQSLINERILEEDHEVDLNTLIQIRNRFGIALKGIFWRKFENNECSAETIKKLTECVDLDLDSA